eukprot:scaffold25445_cov19-Tisochrysis_lutea.AAC.1
MILAGCCQPEPVGVDCPPPGLQSVRCLDDPAHLSAGAGRKIWCRNGPESRCGREGVQRWSVSAW